MKRHFLPILLIVAISMALYANTLKNGFVYDDESTIVKNVLIKDLWNLPKLFEAEYFAQSGEVTYRPAVTFTYFMDYTLYGLKSWGFHLTNLLLHTINGIMLYLFSTLLINKPTTQNIEHSKQGFINQPLLIVLLFVTHPVLTEAVNAISFREDLLAFLFYIVTLWLYLQLNTSTSANRKSILYAISCTAYSLALLSKEMAITLPLIVYCYEWIYSERNKKLDAILSNRYNAGYIAITFVYTYLRFYHFRDPREAGFQQGWEFAERLSTIPYLLLSNLKLTLFPISLSASYEIVSVALFSLQFMLTTIITILLIGISFKIMKLKKEASYGMLFYIITLSPVYNIIPIPFPLAERYLYLPVAGFCIAVVSISQPKSKVGFYPVILFFVIFSIFLLGVINRNTAWRDDISLWSDAIIKMPNNSYSQFSLGLAYQEKGLFEKAVTHYKTALRLKPDHADAYNNLGNIYLEQQQYEEAIRHFNNALSYRPNAILFRNNLGLAYYETGQLEKAILHYKIALKLNPDYSDTHNNLGSAYADQGKIEEAIKEYRTAIMLDSLNARARNNLGLILVNQHKFDEAIQEYHNAIRIEPTLLEVRYNLGIAYLKTGLKSKARMELETALKVKPDFAQARRALASIDNEKNQ